MKKKLIRIFPAAVVIALLAVFLIYTGQYYHADQAALDALVSDDAVLVSEKDYGWFFDGPLEENALVFYPGGKVEETAYAPLCRALARKGMDVCLVRMPFRLAVFGVNKADDVIGDGGGRRWYLAGHSLGGAMASVYAAENPDRISGLFLLGAYSARQLREDTSTILIYGSEDHVLNREKFSESLSLVPDGALEFVIQGGNHAQFGSYGAQRGDGTALISPEEQTEETAAILLSSAGLAAG